VFALAPFASTPLATGSTATELNGVLRVGSTASAGLTLVSPLGGAALVTAASNNPDVYILPAQTSSAMGGMTLNASPLNAKAPSISSMAASIAVSTKATVALATSYILEASSQSTSAAQGSVDKTSPLAVNAVAQSKSTAGINVDYIVASDVQSNVIATSNLARIVILQSGWSTAAVNTSPLGSAPLHSGDAGVVSANSTANVTLSVWNTLEASVKVESWAFGALFSTIPLADVAGTGSVSNVGQANLVLQSPLAGQVEVIAVSTATTSVHYRLDAVVSVDSESSGAVVLQSPLQGQLTTQSELVGNVTLVSPIGSEIVVASESFAGLVNTIPMDAVVYTISRSNGAVKVDYVVSGNVVTLVSMGGGVTNTIPMDGVPDTGAVASSDGGIVLRIPFDAAVQGVVSTTAKARKFHTNSYDTLRPTGADVLPHGIAAELGYREITATDVNVNMGVSAEVELIQPTLYKRTA